MSTSAPPIERRILLLISYDGTDYSGFAIQNNAPTISGVLRDALVQIDPEVGKITGSSRTDAGVHARHQPVSFTTSKPLTSRGWVLALAQRLPLAVSVIYAAEVPLSFDPRRDPVFKRYCYRVYPSQVFDPFLSRISWRVGQAIDLQVMQTEAQCLLGEHDFRAFRSVDDQRTETVRNISRLEIKQQASGCIEIVVEGNRFMYNMVRIIAGTLVEVGLGRKAQGACQRALLSGERRDLGMTAPAQGLMLEHVELRNFGENGWPARQAAAGSPQKSPDTNS